MTLTFGLFLRGEVLALVVAEDGDRFLTLLDHALEHGEDIGVCDFFPRRARVDVLLLEARVDEADGADGNLVSAFHGGLEGVVEFCAFAHDFSFLLGPK
jgi:hypothetical protein